MDMLTAYLSKKATNAIAQFINKNKCDDQYDPDLFEIAKKIKGKEGCATNLIKSLALSSDTKKKLRNIIKNYRKKASQIALSSHFG